MVVIESKNVASYVLIFPIEWVMLSIFLSVIIVIVQSLTTTMLKDEVIFRLAPVSGSTYGISDVVVSV